MKENIAKKNNDNKLISLFDIWEEESMPASVDCIEDGLIASLNHRGKVDLEYISEISGCDKKEIIRTLKGAIYQNPEKWDGCWYQGFETADEYLSGNLLKKYRAAQEADNAYPGCFQDNLEALRKLMPDYPDTDKIYITPGSPWVPADVIDDFIQYLSGSASNEAIPDRDKVVHDPKTGLWEIPHKNRFRASRAAFRDREVFGTPEMPMLKILQATLNMRTPFVYKEELQGGIFTGKRIVDEKETILAIEKQRLLIQTFREWVWTNQKREKRLKRIYEESFASITKRNFDGSYLSFPGMNREIELYPYQKNAVARILFTPNTLLAHDVGSGKTYVMIAAGMEMRRLGMSQKNLYVVPNNLIGQWKKIFYEMYPQANLLIADPKSFKKEKRNDVLKKIAEEDYDGILMAYSCFDMLPLSEKYYKEYCKEEKAELIETRKNMYTDGPANHRIQRLNTVLKNAHDEAQKFSCRYYFDQLGITTMFVDEAHNYKNIPIDTQIRNSHSINAEGSKKCSRMMDKVRCIQNANGGRGVVFATGTPITNSITDIFAMQKYLQNGELTLLGLQNFDSWVGMFAEQVTSYEIDIDTNSYHLVTRFSHFHNLPELAAILASIADFHKEDAGNGIPLLDGYTDTEIDGSPEFREYLKNISERADDVRKHRVPREVDNLLKITMDGKKAALDMRLVSDAILSDTTTKAEACAENVYDIYRKTEESHLTQLVFCDSSIPKKTFNLYDEIRKLLVKKGVNPSEIAFVHSADTDKKRECLFKSVREGKVRVLIGSTYKLGMGVNVQKKLIAIHHLDLPWRPSDMVQREGRILRPGNTNPNVKIYRYVTKGSFDAYSWQILETKQRFISQLLSCSVTNRSENDVDSTVLNYAEIKALAIGNPLIKKRCELCNRLDRERILQRNYQTKRARLMQEKSVIPEKISRVETHIEFCEQDKATYARNKRIYDKEETKNIRECIAKAVLAGADLPEKKEIIAYQGFQISVPAHMQSLKPTVLIEGAGKYYLEIGKEAGITTRLDNFLEKFDQKIEEYRKSIDNLRQRSSAIDEELAKDESHEEIIEALTKELNQTDKELGIDNESKCS